MLVAGSVIAGEEPAVLEGFRSIQQEWPQALLIVAPRKPEQFLAAAEMLRQAGWRLVRRSDISIDGLSAGILHDTDLLPKSVLLLDTIGELAALYGLADVVFVGGSLQPPGGGHNPLEPAAYGKVPIFGPSMQNFRQIATSLLEADAAIEVNSGAQLAAAWERLLKQDAARAEMGSAARAIVERNRGATAATLDHVTRLIEQRARA